MRAVLYFGENVKDPIPTSLVLVSLYIGLQVVFFQCVLLCLPDDGREGAVC